MATHAGDSEMMAEASKHSCTCLLSLLPLGPVTASLALALKPVLLVCSASVTDTDTELSPATSSFPTNWGG